MSASAWIGEDVVLLRGAPTNDKIRVSLNIWRWCWRMERRCYIRVHEVSKSECRMQCISAAHCCAVSYWGCIIVNQLSLCWRCCDVSILEKSLRDSCCCGARRARYAFLHHTSLYFASLRLLLRKPSCKLQFLQLLQEESFWFALAAGLFWTLFFFPSVCAILSQQRTRQIDHKLKVYCIQTWHMVSCLFVLLLLMMLQWACRLFVPVPAVVP